MMKRELRDKWADMLESGEYKQCRNTLEKHDSYCCLGVLALACGNKPGDLLYPSDATLGPRWQAVLIDANDEERKSFRQIAEIVRAIPVED